MENTMLKYIYKKSLKYRGLLLLVNLLLIVIYICEIIIPYTFSNFIDLVIETKLFNSVYMSVVIISLTLIILLFSSFVKSVSSEYLVSKVNNDILNELGKKLERIPLKETRKYSPAYLNQRLFNDIITSVSFVHENLSVAIIMTLSTLVLLILITVMQKLMLFVVIVAILINTVGILFFHKLMYKRGYEYREIHSLYYASNNERIASIKETKTHSWYDISGFEVNENHSKLLKKGIQIQRVIAAIDNVGALSKNMSLIMTILIGGYLFTKNELSIGQLILITTYTNMCLSNAESFLKLGQEYQHAKLAYDRLVEFLIVPDEINGEVVLKNINTVEVNELFFAYEESKTLFSSFSLKLKKGNIYCFKGKNGKGKSTLIDLLLGLNYDYVGTITFDGVDIRDLDMISIRKTMISTILQDTKVQRLSVMQNLIKGLNVVNEFDVLDLCNIFNMKEIIDSENSHSLSGGEKQKVSVIRGLLKHSEILILDEPVSAMDSDGIIRLKEILVSIKANKIIILISHNEDIFDIVDEYIEINEYENS